MPKKHLRKTTSSKGTWNPNLGPPLFGFFQKAFGFLWRVVEAYILYNVNCKLMYTWIFQICKISANPWYVFWVNFGTNFTHLEDPGMSATSTQRKNIKQISEHIQFKSCPIKTQPGKLALKTPPTFDVAPGLNSVVSAGRFVASWLRY